MNCLYIPSRGKCPSIKAIHINIYPKKEVVFYESGTRKNPELKVRRYIRGYEKQQRYILGAKRHETLLEHDLRPEYESKSSRKKVLEHQRKSSKFASGSRHQEEVSRSRHQESVSRSRPFFTLTSVEQEQARSIINETPNNDVIIDKYNIQLTGKLIRCLKPRTWLNDEVINFYMNMLIDREPKSYFFSTFFMNKLEAGKYRGVEKWSKKAKIDVLKLHKVFIPIHINNNHWTLGVINVRDQRFEYYDSLGGKGVQQLLRMREYLIGEGRTYHKKELDLTTWKDYVPYNIPHQVNYTDCGVFTLMYADYLSRDQPLNFAPDEENIAMIRQYIALRIQQGTLK